MLLSVALFGLGGALLLIGVAWLSLPVAVIVVGALLIGYALWRDDGQPDVKQ